MADPVVQPSFVTPNPGAFWGKTTKDGGRLPVQVHLRDTEAVGLALARHHALTASLANAWNEDPDVIESFLAFQCGLHDAGKYCKPFQDMLSNWSDPERIRDYPHTLALWDLLRLDNAERATVFGEVDGYELIDLLKVLAPSIGHHGHAVRRTLLEGPQHPLWTTFPEFNRQAAWAMIRDLASRHAAAMPLIRRLQADLRIYAPFSWTIAGFVVTADWLASNKTWFEVDANRTTQPHDVESALAAAGISAVPVTQTPIESAFEFNLRPMQKAVQSYPSQDSLFLIEDETGSGKTEAAIILAHRLMRERDLCGLYFALPTQATSNAMHKRLLGIARRLFVSQPQIVLAHSDRNVVPSWIQPRSPSDSNDVGAECSAWLRDHAKASLLAQVGVGTVDQAIAAALPLKHQCLRTFGLHKKILIVDEVHAFDAYQHGLLSEVISHHIATGGVVILLSATLPSSVHAKFGIFTSQEYPRISSSNFSEHVPNRVAKAKSMAPISSVDEALSILAKAQAERKSAAWIRNTVQDAVEAYELAKGLNINAILIHSRFTLADRAEREALVETHCGSDSGPEHRQFIVISTQVLEQSIDADFDAMISDLAPMDVLLQRMGRLHRHARAPDGSRADVDSRPPALLHVLVPLDEEPTLGMFPEGTTAVYEHQGVLWKTLHMVRKRPTIQRLQDIDEAVEEAYSGPYPDVLRTSIREAEGYDAAKRSIAAWTRLKLTTEQYADFTAPASQQDAPSRFGMNRCTILLVHNGKPARGTMAASRIHASQSAVRNLPLTHESDDPVLADLLKRKFIAGFLEDDPRFYCPETGLCKPT